MHLGNIYTAVLSWLSARSAGGRWLLRIEDLDPQRSKPEYARQIEDDLRWLGLEWDEGGIGNKGTNGPYVQSLRNDFYNEALEKLKATGLTYPCRCRRADIMASQAPHQSDGRIVYAGTCRPAAAPPFPAQCTEIRGATRLYVPDEEITFCDRVFGKQTVNLARHCGDFVLRRADGAWAYQLAVVVDDAAMGVTEVVRGCDLLLSSVQQIYLYGLLGADAPEFAHLPLVCNENGIRLSKRDSGVGMAELRTRKSPQQILGLVAAMAGLTDKPSDISLDELLGLFNWEKIKAQEQTNITI